MIIQQKYNSNENYIGNSQSQYKFTKLIYKKYSALNYTSFIHDIFYKILWNEKGILNLFILKFLFDLVFLIMGIFRSLRKLKFVGVGLTIILYLILLFSSFWYIWKIKQN